MFALIGGAVLAIHAIGIYAALKILGIFMSFLFRPDQ